MHPQPAGEVPMHVLATGQGLQVAAAARAAGHRRRPGPGGGDPEPGLAALAGYRRDFRPSPQQPEPRVSVSLDVLVADTAAEAAELPLPEAWAMARSRTTGAFPPLEPVATIRSSAWPDQLRRRVEASLDRALAGGPATVRRSLERLAGRTGADELMASTSTYDRDALLASDTALRDLVRGRARA